MKTILIANRGEIAVRLLQTIQHMGFRGVAVYSDADVDALHVRLADGACRIGPAPARESYLKIEAILDAAKNLNADAIHPGYGFLAENAEFAQAVMDAGLIWIGPPPAAMRSMGNKAGAKRLLADRGVPMLPGYQGKEQDHATLLKEAARIGMPLMIKAAAGGGGRGMRLVTDACEIESSLARARSEAEQAFGSGELILERALIAPRHIEIQVFADTQGNVIHLGERDCSVQRRHQKIIEETPSPAMTPELREQMGKAGVEAARACGYVGAGTVEFLLDADGNFWFMEMNTRLQVEHPVTEAITGLDLVEWQLRVAMGESLPFTQEQVDEQLAQGGHAIEVRLCAEDPAHDFLPQAGLVAIWREPQEIRVEHALEDGQVISPYYDSMVGKLISHSSTREEARRKLVQQLNECVLLGIPTNQDFLIECLNHPEFISGKANTGFIGEFFSADKLKTLPSDFTQRSLAAGLLLASRMQNVRQNFPDELRGWNSNSSLEYPIEFDLDGMPHTLTAQADGAGGWQLRDGKQTASIKIKSSSPHALELKVQDETYCLAYANQDNRLYFRAAGRNHVLTDLANQPAQKKNAGTSDGILRAPMNGRVTLLKARPGESVIAGQTLIVLEAMKMEHTLTSPYNGILKATYTTEGEQVAPGKMLMEVTPKS